MEPGFLIPVLSGIPDSKPRIPDSTIKKFKDSGIQIPLQGATFHLQFSFSYWLVNCQSCNIGIVCQCYNFETTLTVDKSLTEGKVRGPKRFCFPAIYPRSCLSPWVDLTVLPKHTSLKQRSRPFSTRSIGLDDFWRLHTCFECIFCVHAKTITLSAKTKVLNSGGFSLTSVALVAYQSQSLRCLTLSFLLRAWWF